MVKARNRSTDGTSSASTASGGISSSETQEEILGRLKDMLFNADLIVHLESHPTDGLKIKELLKKVDVQTADAPLIKFVAEASTFVDQLLMDLAQRKELQAKRLPKEKDRITALAFVESSLAASEKLQQDLEEKKAAYITRRTQIFQWHQQILVLKKQIEGLESQISEAQALQAVGFGAVKQALNNEALVGVAHLERVSALDLELAELDSSISLTDACLEIAKDHYLRLKDSAPF